MREHSAYRYAKGSWVLDGTVIDTFWWERDKGTFCLLVPGDEVPLRSVHMRHVVSIDGVLVTGWNLPKDSFRTWEVESASDRGVTYRVTFDGREWRCGCRGFSFHQHCRHVDQIKSKEEACPV
jgi:hypothetical protein